MTNTCICSAILTPLDDRERLHVDGLQEHLRDQAEAGIDAVLVGGTMGLMQLLTEKTYADLVRAACDSWSSRRDFRGRRRYEPVPHFAADPHRQRIQGRRRFGPGAVFRSVFAGRAVRLLPRTCRPVEIAPVSLRYSCAHGNQPGDRYRGRVGGASQYRRHQVLWSHNANARAH